MTIRDDHIKIVILNCDHGGFCSAVDAFKTTLKIALKGLPEKEIISNMKFVYTQFKIELPFNVIVLLTVYLTVSTFTFTNATSLEISMKTWSINDGLSKGLVLL